MLPPQDTSAKFGFMHMTASGQYCKWLQHVCDQDFGSFVYYTVGCIVRLLLSTRLQTPCK